MASYSLCNNFLDFENASFYPEHREILWTIMTSCGIPQKIVKMVHILYEDSECTVLDEGKESGWFKVKAGVNETR